MDKVLEKNYAEKYIIRSISTDEYFLDSIGHTPEESMSLFLNHRQGYLHSHLYYAPVKEKFHCAFGDCAHISYRCEVVKIKLDIKALEFFGRAEETGEDPWKWRSNNYKYSEIPQ